MQQTPLWHDSLGGALWSTAEALGPKDLAHELWPEKTPEEAAKLLSRCCDADRNEKLSPEQIELIVRRGREHGCHIVMHYLSQRAGYTEPHPVEPEDERAKLQRDFIEAQEHMQALVKRMERLP